MPGIPIVAGILFGHQAALFLLWDFTNLAVFQAPKEGTKESSLTFRE